MSDIRRTTASAKIIFWLKSCQALVPIIYSTLTTYWAKQTDHFWSLIRNLSWTSFVSLRRHQQKAENWTTKPHFQNKLRKTRWRRWRHRKLRRILFQCIFIPPKCADWEICFAPKRWTRARSRCNWQRRAKWRLRRNTGGQLTTSRPQPRGQNGLDETTDRSFRNMTMTLTKENFFCNTNLRCVLCCILTCPYVRSHDDNELNSKSVRFAIQCIYFKTHPLTASNANVWIEMKYKIFYVSVSLTYNWLSGLIIHLLRHVNHLWPS